MIFKSLGRIAGIGALALGLGGCFDMTMELEALTETTGASTIIQTMPADIYAMVAQAPAGQGGFCSTPEDGELTVDADGSATCTKVIEGAYAELENADEADSFDATVVSPGVVRFAFRAETVGSQIQEEGGSDPQVASMINAMFDGRNMTIRILGSELVETNMTPTADGRGAELVVPFISLIDGTADLPPELFAVVRTQQ